MKAELIFHEKVKDASGIVEIKLWSVPITSVNPHGYKYSMVYIREGKRVLGYDNHEGKGDHRHYGEREEHYRFTSIDKLFEDFYEDIRRFRK